MFLVARKVRTNTSTPSKRLETRKKMTTGVSVRRRYSNGEQKSIQFTIGFDICKQLGLHLGTYATVFFGWESDEGEYLIRKPDLPDDPKFQIYADSKDTRGLYNVVATYTFPDYMLPTGDNPPKNAFCEYTINNGCLRVKIPPHFMGKTVEEKPKPTVMSDPYETVARTHNITANMLRHLRKSASSGHSIYETIPPIGRDLVMNGLKIKGMVTDGPDPKLTPLALAAVQEVNSAVSQTVSNTIRGD